MAPAQNPYIHINHSPDSINKELAKKTTLLKRFDLLNRKGGYYFALGKMDSLTPVTKEMLSLSQQLNNDSIYTVTYNLIGDYFMNRGNFADAIEYFFKGIATGERARDRGYLCSVNLDISLTYNSLGEYDEALKYARKSMTFLSDKKLLQTNLPIQVYGAIAAVFVSTGNLDSALFYIQQGNEAAARVKDDFQAVYLDILSGTIYTTKNEFELAEAFYKKAIRTSHSISALYSSVDGEYGYASLLYKKGDYVLAKQYCMQALEHAMQGRGYPAIVLCSDLCKRIYLKTGNRDSIYKYAMLKDAYIDTLNTLTKTNKLNDITFNQMLREIEEAGRERQARQELKMNLQYVTISLACIAFLILFLIFSHSILANQRLIRFLGIIALLIVFEFFNLLLHPYLADITHHSPILMLLVMVAIAALLIPLHHRLEHWLIKRLVEKNKRIRLSAAKKIIAKLEGEVNE